MNKLFSPLEIGPYTLQHRVVMAPLTRMRAESGDRPGELMREYYGQRASQGGLIITEATAVAGVGIAYAGAPGLYDDSQIAGWKRITEAVHARGGRIFVQLWHAGRMAHPQSNNGEQPVGPSPIAAEGFAVGRNGQVTLEQPRALERHEIPLIVEQFRSAARRALLAGFDGVELHGANGYLPDQFLQDNSNLRTDEYGGSILNRTRFFLELVDALTQVWGAERVGVRVSPAGGFGSMADSDPQALFGYLARQLDAYGLAYLHTVEPRVRDYADPNAFNEPMISKQLRAHFHGPILSAGGFKGDSARAILDRGEADLVAFGRLFIANPDLPERLRHGLPLNAYDRSTFYGGDHRGYTDYPAYVGAASGANCCAT
jgi:N-ethylmaleimide reductase